MSKVILEKIGNPVQTFMQTDQFDKNLEKSGQLNKKYINMKNELKQGWGKDYIKRVHMKGKMTAWERIEELKDQGSEIFPFGSFVNWGEEFGEGENKKKSPSAGVITAFIRIKNRYVTIIANDNTVASGSWWPKTPEKIQRAQEISLKLRIPVIYLIDSSGLFLPEQSRSFPGRTGAGHIFKMNSLLSSNQIPQLAGVFGDCIAGGGYMPIISDIVYMTEKAYMVIAGAALVKGAKSQKITSLTIGGADVHVHISNCADFRVPDDQTLLLKLREEIGKLPTSAVEYYRYGCSKMPPTYSSKEIGGIIPADHRMTYESREILARLTDNSLFKEYFHDSGEEIICGIGRVNGLYMAFIANNLELIRDPVSGSGKKPGGILYREGISKITNFLRCCDDDGIPVIWLQDISGFDIGPEAEKEGLLGYGSNLLYAISNTKTPMFTFLLRKASGAGYYAMNGIPFDPVLQFSTPLTRLSVMEGKTLAIGTYNSKLDDNFKIVTKDPEELKKIKDGMAAIETKIEEDMNPLLSASRMDTDEIITLDEIRKYIEMLAEIAYQSTGYRRIKNPRIWSLHDIERF